VTARPRIGLAVLIVAGIAVRVVVAWLTGGLPFDVESFELLRSALDGSHFHVYSAVNAHGFRWPYPSGFFPLVLLVGALADLFGGGFGHLIRAPAIGADAALAWLVWKGLAGRVDERGRLGAAGLVALGPVFITISGYAAQIDSVAILPAVGALLVWERGGPRERAWVAGALIGVGAAIKTVPILMVLALAPTAQSRRELAQLAVAAAAVVLLAMAPFLIADGSGARHIVHYSGLPGMGGLSLVLQPDLAERWLTRVVEPSGLESWLFIRHSGLENAAVVLGFAAWAARRRPGPRTAAALLWLLVLAFGSGFFFQYLVWGLPFFLLAGHLRATALLQALVTVPMLLFYLGPWHTQAIVYVYAAIMLAVWLGWVLAAAWLVRSGPP
jgi:hypothetical protein